MTDYNRVVITGIGVVCSAGKNIIEFWDSISSGKCCISKIQHFDTSKYSSNIAGEIKDFKFNFSPKKVKSKYIGRATSLLLEAIDEAFKNANINLAKINSDRVGAVLGCTLGELKQGQEIYDYWIDRKNKKIRPSYLVTFPIYRPLDIVTLEFGISGPKSLITTACASGTNSIGYASDLIHRGKADMMVTGGIDPLSRLSYAGFDGLMLLSKTPCAPFSRQSGLSLGEGAGILILENLNSALKRNAPILAEVLGYGLSGDAFHSTAPDPSGSGPARAMDFAIQDAAISQESIDYINAHGTGTKFNDPTETKAIKLIFGERAKQVPISSTKSMIGHTLGAAGAIESIATILTLKNDVVPPTANFTEPDEGCDLDYVPNKAREKTVNIALSNSFGFGGNNAAIVLSKYSDHKSSSKKQIDNRVVITGLGIVNPMGIGIDNFWKNVIVGKSGLKPITSFDTSKYASKKGGEITDFNPKDFIHFSRLRRMDRLSQLAVTSTKLAIEDSDLVITNENCERIGLIFGTGTGPMDSIMGSITEVYTEASAQKLTTVSPARFLNTVFNAAAGHVSIEFKIKGLNSTIAMGGVSSSNAMCYAYDLVKTGRADAICVVSSDEIGETLFAGYSKLGILAKKNGNISEDSRPFDKDRNGFIISEGSATII
jgi:3-oxoacyl-[acyl-carrier-protein] synthase II